VTELGMITRMGMFLGDNHAPIPR